MAEQAKKTTKNTNNSNLIFGICAAIVVVVIIVVAIVLAARGGINGALNDAYFVSDGSKYVLNIETDPSESDMAPVKAHLVYYYSGDNITDMKGFYEFADEATAQSAYNFYNSENDGAYKSVELNGKFVILTANEADYEGLKASDVKQQIDMIESNQNGTQEQIESLEESVETPETSEE